MIDEQPNYEKTVGSVDNYNIVRPLLSVSRFETGKLCSFWQLPIYPDISNQKIKFFRNRVRKQLIPIVKLFFNSKIENVFLQLAEIVEAEDKHMSQVTKNLFTSFNYISYLNHNTNIKTTSQHRSALFFSINFIKRIPLLPSLQFCINQLSPSITTFIHTQHTVVPKKEESISSKRNLPTISYVPYNRTLRTEGKEMVGRWYVRRWYVNMYKMVCGTWYVDIHMCCYHTLRTEGKEMVCADLHTISLPSVRKVYSNNSNPNKSNIRKMFTKKAYINNVKQVYNKVNIRKNLYWPIIVSSLPIPFQRRVSKLLLTNKNQKNITYSQIENLLQKKN